MLFHLVSNGFMWFDMVPALRASLRRDLPLVDLTLFYLVAGYEIRVTSFYF